MPNQETQIDNVVRTINTLTGQSFTNGKLFERERILSILLTALEDSERLAGVAFPAQIRSILAKIDS